MFDRVEEKHLDDQNYKYPQTFSENESRFDMVASFFFADGSCHFQTCRHIEDLINNILIYLRLF